MEDNFNETVNIEQEEFMENAPTDLTPQPERPKWYKNKKILAAIAGVAVVSVGITSFICLNQPIIRVKAAEKTIEVGEKVVITKEALLDKNKMDKNIYDDIVMTTDLTRNEVKYTYNKKTGEVVTEDQEYLAAGTYTVKFTVNNEENTVKIKVQDTKNPEFVGNRETITVEQNAEGFDLKNYYLAEDKSDVHIEAKNPSITEKKEVKATVNAKDKFDNTEKKKINVRIVTQEDIKNGVKLTPMIDGNVPVTEDTLEKAKSGELDIQVEDLDEDIAKKMKEIESDDVKGTTSYEDTGDTSNTFNRKAFTTNGDESMESLGMTYKEYREYVNNNFIDPETGLIKGEYDRETNTYKWVDENGKEHSISADGLGIQPEDRGDEYWDWVNSQQKPSSGGNTGGNTGGSNTGGSSGGSTSGGNTGGSGNNSGNTGGNTGGGNTGGGSTETPTEPVEPTPPACDDTIPAGGYTDMHAAGQVAQAYLNSLIDSGIFDQYTGYKLIPNRTACGTLYYTISYY